MRNNTGDNQQFRKGPLSQDTSLPTYPAEQPNKPQSNQFRPVLPVIMPFGSNLSPSSANYEGQRLLAPSVSGLDQSEIWKEKTQSILVSPVPVIDKSADSSLRTTRWRALKRRNIALISIFCFIALLGTIGFSIWHFVLYAIPDVTLYRVSMKSVDMPIGGGGVAYPVKRLDISYPFAAHVLSVFVQPGNKITTNQPLVQLDLSQVNAQNLSQLNAEVQQAYQDVVSARTYLNTVSSVGNPVNIAQARQQYDAALSRYQALQAEVNAPTLHQGRLTSTISGVVTAVNIYPGQELSANKVMLTIFDESSIVVRAQLPLSYYGQVAIKQAVQVTPSALPDQTYTGTVISIIPNANSQSGTFEVWAEVANTTGKLLPGMSTFVSVHDMVSALVVPRMAVLNPDQDSIVFVVRNQHAYIQHVQVSGYTSDSVIIGSGLSANDQVVLVGLATLQDGQLVHITGSEN